MLKSVMNHWSYTVFKDKNILFIIFYLKHMHIPTTAWNKKVLPGQRIHRGIRTRNEPAWRRSSCKRSSRGSCTCGGRTSGRGRAGDAAGSETGRRNSQRLTLPASPPVRWCPRQCGPLKESRDRINTLHILPDQKGQHISIATTLLDEQCIYIEYFSRMVYTSQAPDHTEH